MGSFVSLPVQFLPLPSCLHSVFVPHHPVAPSAGRGLRLLRRTPHTPGQLRRPQSHDTATTTTGTFHLGIITLFGLSEMKFSAF